MEWWFPGAAWRGKWGVTNQINGRKVSVRQDEKLL